MRGPWEAVHGSDPPRSVPCFGAWRSGVKGPMPIEYRFDPERRRIYYTATGDIPLGEMIATLDAILTDPAFEPDFDIYGDHTGLGRIVETLEVRALVQRLAGYGDRVAGARWAVVTKQAASYGMMRMLSVYAEQAGLEVEAFRTHAEAQAWLAEPRS